MDQSKYNSANDSGSVLTTEEIALAADKNFAAEFARQIVGQDFVSAHGFLAPWLQAEISPGELREIFVRKLLEMNEYWEIEELILPADFSVSWNSSTLVSLTEPMSWREPRQISERLTDENFRRWMVIQFLPDENDERIEFDGWFDFWCAIAEVNGELKIGYFEFEDAD